MLRKYEPEKMGVKTLKREVPVHVQRPTPEKLGVQTGPSEGNPPGGDLFVATVWIVVMAAAAVIFGIGIISWAS